MTLKTRHHSAASAASTSTTSTASTASAATSGPARLQVRLSDVVRTAGGRTLLDGVNLAAAPGERIGIIGENGSGKTTLIRLLAGVRSPDSGTVAVQAPGGRGYLPQVPEQRPGGTVQDAVDDALAELRALERRMRAAEQALADAGPAQLDRALARYGDLLETFEARDGYAADSRVDAAMSGLGLAGVPRDRALSALSGGERGRLELAGMLAAAPQLMLVDEPTNHLDGAALTWLEERLRSHSGIVIVVSHDRVFLDRVATVLWEVDAERRTVLRHGRGYAGYLADKAADRARRVQAHQDWLAEIARQRELAAAAASALRAAPSRDRDRDNGRHQRPVTKQISARVRNAKERLRRLEDDPVPRPAEPLRFAARLRGGGPGAGVCAELTGVSVADRLDVDAFTVRRGERVLISGPNGAGKSTLLRVLVGDLAPDRGAVRRTARVGWLPQETDATGLGATLLDAFAHGLPGPADEYAGALLGTGLFERHDLATPVPALSAGQARRLALARLLHRPVDLLVLDEPSNHLSPALVEDVEAALAQYRGAVLAVSHDRMFARHFTGRRLRMDGGRFAAE